MDIAVMLKEIQVAPGFFLKIMRLTQLTTFGASVLRTTLRLNFQMKFMRLCTRIQVLIHQFPGRLNPQSQ